MKEFWKKFWKKTKEFLLWLFRQLKDPTNIILFVIVLTVIYAPTWLCGLLGWIFQNGVLISIASGYAAFWLAPFTPFWGFAIALTLGLRKIIDKFFKKH
ncbi:MAG: hypothetical protein IJX49_00080 [Clostridia bacterium]|nr:hypothetical protein [Clostridia bacterium]